MGEQALPSPDFLSRQQKPLSEYPSAKAWATNPLAMETTHPHWKPERARTYVSLSLTVDTLLCQREWKPVCGVRVRVSRVDCFLEQVSPLGLTQKED